MNTNTASPITNVTGHGCPCCGEHDAVEKHAGDGFYVPGSGPEWAGMGYLNVYRCTACGEHFDVDPADWN